MHYCFNFREKGLSKVCDLIEEIMCARMDKLEAENSNQKDRINQFENEMEINISKSLKEAIPECPVKMKFF